MTTTTTIVTDRRHGDVEITLIGDQRCTCGLPAGYLSDGNLRGHAELRCTAADAYGGHWRDIDPSELAAMVLR